MVYWHRLLGVVLTDYLTGSRYKVEMEKDLSFKQQMLDVLIIEQSSGPRLKEPPDGLENLGRHNLLTFKSLRQSLDAWSMDELIGHYVNYRKQASPSLKRLLPAKDFRLYATCMRKPKKLGRGVVLECVKQGVYEVQWGGCRVRVIVSSEMPKINRNALWQLFSGIAEKVRFGAVQYNWRKQEFSKSINTLFDYYRIEGIAMPYTIEDFEREYEENLLEKLTSKRMEKFLKKLPPEVLLKKLPPEVLLKKLPPEARLKGLPPEARLKGLPPEARLKGLPPEELLKRLTRSQIEAYLKKLKAAK